MKQTLRFVVIFGTIMISLLLPASDIASSSSTSISPITQILGITTGAHIVPVKGYGNEIISFNNLTGKKSGVVMYFADWGGNGASDAFDDYLPNEIEQQIPNPTDRPVIMITWQPINAKAKLGCDRDYTVVPLDALASGKCDGYIRAYVDGIGTRPVSERYIIRFAHEMNITDSPWWPGHTGEDATAYVNAFRHVHDVFVAEMARLGMTNIEWMWSPNYASNPPYPWNDIHNYYPGDRYVDWIGLSGYNWNRGGVPWMTFSQLYDSVLKDFACNYAKPVIIAEIGSVDGYTSAENKPAWISDAYLSMQSYGFLRGVTWFNDYAYDNVNQPDFRVTTSTRISGSVSPLPYSNGSWTNSYKTSISPSVYTSQLPLARNVTPPFTYCGTGEPVYNVSPATTILQRGESSVHTLTGISYSVAQSITINPPKDISAVVFPSALTPPWDKATITLKISPNASYGIYSVPIKVGDVNLSIRVSVLEHVYRNYAPLIDR